MLLASDEYPFHQIAQTFAGAASSDPAWNDGHYVTATDDSGTVSFTSNLRLYPNNDVMDGFVCLRFEDRQYNVRVSRALRPAVDTLAVGPLRLDIVRPMDQVRLVLEPCTIAGVELSVDVTCTTHTAPYMGPIEVTRVDGRLLSERATYELAGPCDGTIRIGGKTIEWRPGSARFFRNHSWGLQPGRGGPRPYGTPTPSRRAPGMRHWVLFDFDDHSGFFFIDPSGRAASGKGAILESGRIVPLADAQSDVELFDPHARLRRGVFRLTDIEGRTRTYEFEQHGWVYCQGGGYFSGFDDGLGQGVFRGTFHSEGETWDVSHPVDVASADGTVRRFGHDWAESFVHISHEGATGLGHYECVRVG